MWFVYIAQCADGTLYTGVTKNLERRETEHNHGNRGAKSLRYRRPVSIVYNEIFDTETQAKKREFEIKSWKRYKKLQLITGPVAQR